MKILYVCPFAHYSGHHPHVATVEPRRLASIGLDVSLLTFSGIINDTQVRIKHIKVLYPEKHPFIHKVLKRIRYYTLPRWALMLVETVLTIRKAVKLSRKEGYEILHLRDGEPFLFLSHIISLPHKNIKWAISLTAAVVFEPKVGIRDIIKKPFVFLYASALYWVNSGAWKILYKWSLRRNQFIFMPQNQVATESYKEYMDGIFKNNVMCVEWGIDKDGQLPSKQEARNRLGIPQDVFTMLSFGAPHSGKCMKTVFEAVCLCPDVYIIHGGTHTFSLGDNPQALADKYNLNGRAKIFSYYIPEEEKPYFFAAADVSILSYTKVFACTSSMIWESAKYRLPVISSDANTLGEDVDRYGLGVLFEAENEQALVDAIDKYRALSDTELELIKRNCDRFLDDYSDVKWAEKCEKVYERLIYGNS